MSKVPNIVQYHQQGREPIELHVVEKHDNGTVDLAREKGGKPIITGIAISDEPGDGKCTAVVAKKAKKKEQSDEGGGTGEGEGDEGGGGEE